MQALWRLAQRAHQDVPVEVSSIITVAAQATASAAIRVSWPLLTSTPSE